MRSHAPVAPPISDGRGLRGQRSSKVPSPPRSLSSSRPSFELVINLRAAKAIGLTIPASFILRADEVIE
jgi:ABC-type uncharacterized transport system substrate-binding protein